MTSITWASPRYVQEVATILGLQNPTQRSCDVQVHTHSTALENISMTTEAINAEKRRNMACQNVASVLVRYQ